MALSYTDHSVRGYIWIGPSVADRGRVPFNIEYTQGRIKSDLGRDGSTPNTAIAKASKVRLPPKKKSILILRVYTYTKKEFIQYL